MPHATATNMADTTQGTPPKKRSFFKRAAWQDDTPKEGDDMFSHANEFKDIVADENRRRREQEEKRQRKHAESRQQKRRRVSADNEANPLAESKLNATKTGKLGKTGKTKYTSKSPSPTVSHAPPDSLAARYEALTDPTTANELPTHKKPLIIDLDDDDDSSYPKTLNTRSNPSSASWHAAQDQVVPVRSFKLSAMDHDELEEVPDPMLAALEAKARERAALRAQAAAAPKKDGEFSVPLVAQLFIKPQIPDTNPLLVKVRIDSTLQKARAAWCAKQGLDERMADAVFFTWKGRRLHDSTNIQRLDIQVDQHGNVSVKGDDTIYDDENLPKVVVEAWTEEFFQKRQQEEAEEKAAKLKAAEVPSTIEERKPTPESSPKAKGLRVVLKAKNKAPYRLVVHMDTTFGHLANAYKQANSINGDQPITLMFDGQRLSPIDTVADADIEDMDAIDVVIK